MAGQEAEGELHAEEISMKSFYAHGYTIFMYDNFYLGHSSDLCIDQFLCLSSLTELERQCPGGCPNVMYVAENGSPFSGTHTRIGMNEMEEMR